MDDYLWFESLKYCGDDDVIFCFKVSRVWAEKWFDNYKDNYDDSEDMPHNIDEFHDIYYIYDDSWEMYCAAVGDNAVLEEE